ncbi:MAG TPA: type II toxin-antitoxin system RelB/DinJ family antitoxin [Candidatus Paceibacterota bacterium]|nr:type II toxin-antitoxin system RelB/DinJ family antitoxin [Candidatus Paceibacterota bacterium]
MTTTIQVRIDAKLKKDAQSVFENMGLDLSSGVKLYLTQVIREQGLPFTPRTVNGHTAAYESRLVRAAAQAKKSGASYRSAKSAMRDLLK